MRPLTCFGRLPTHVQQLVYLLYGTEGLLPQVHRDGALQLLKTHVHETRDHLLLVQLERVLLVLVLLRLGKMVPQLQNERKEK